MTSDQMHLIHDFEALDGLSPMNILRELGDSRPDALAASTRRDVVALS